MNKQTVEQRPLRDPNVWEEGNNEYLIVLRGMLVWHVTQRFLAKRLKTWSISRSSRGVKGTVKENMESVASCGIAVDGLVRSDAPSG